MPPNRLRFSYDVQEYLRNLVRITHDFSNRGIRSQSFEQFKTFEPNSRWTYELQELATDCANQLRFSRTEYDSATNPNICQFVSIRGIRDLCGIGVVKSFLKWILCKISLVTPQIQVIFVILTKRILFCCQIFYGKYVVLYEI